MEHIEIPPGEIHTPYQWIVADQAARLAIVPEAADQHKLCLQLDPGNQWRLSSVSPVTWAAVSPEPPSSMPSYLATQSLGGHRVVIRVSAGIAYADASNATHLGRIIGLTTGAITAGAMGEVCLAGEIDEPSWNWSLGSPVFVGTNGMLTQAAPASLGCVFSQVVGFPITPTKLFVQLRQPLVLGA